MKSSVALSLFALAGSVVGQAQIIINVVNTIASGVTDFDNIVKGYNGGSTDTLLASAQKLSDTTNGAINTVKGSGPLSLTDAVTVQGAVTTLQNALDSAMNDLISKKSVLTAAGQAGTVQSNLQNQLSQAKSLQAAITSKVPPEAQALATQLSAGINTALQKAVDAYAGSTNGPSAGGSTPSSSSSGHSGMSGSGSTTSTGAKPATFTGAASSFQVPVLGAIALGAAVFAL